VGCSASERLRSVARMAGSMRSRSGWGEEDAVGVTICLARLCLRKGSDVKGRRLFEHGLQPR
jgi:hypothetical protein